MKKYFYIPHIERLLKDFDEVKTMGSAAAEEWVKGLDQEGKDKMSDAARWEQWEAKGGLRRVNLRPALKATSSQPLHTSNGASASPLESTAVNDVRSDRSTPVSTHVPAERSGATLSPAPSIPTGATPFQNRPYCKCHST